MHLSYTKWSLRHQNDLFIHDMCLNFVAKMLSLTPEFRLGTFYDWNVIVFAFFVRKNSIYQFIFHKKDQLVNILSVKTRTLKAYRYLKLLLQFYCVLMYKVLWPFSQCRINISDLTINQYNKTSLLGMQLVLVVLLKLSIRYREVSTIEMSVFYGNYIKYFCSICLS